MFLKTCIAIQTVILLICRFFNWNGCPGWVAMLLLLSVLPANSMEPVDPEKPVFQTNWLLPDWAAKSHPGIDEKQYTTPEELVELEKQRFNIKNRQRLMDLGLLFLKWGTPMFFIAFFASPMLKQYQFQMISHFLFPVGLGLASSGVVLRELARWYIVAPVAVVLLLIYAVLSHYRRDKGIEIKNPLKKKKSQGNGNNATK